MNCPVDKDTIDEPTHAGDETVAKATDQPTHAGDEAVADASGDVPTAEDQVTEHIILFVIILNSRIIIKGSIFITLAFSSLYSLELESLLWLVSPVFMKIIILNIRIIIEGNIFIALAFSSFLLAKH